MEVTVKLAATARKVAVKGYAGARVVAAVAVGEEDWMVEAEASGAKAAAAAKAVKEAARQGYTEGTRCCAPWAAPHHCAGQSRMSSIRE